VKISTIKNHLFIHLYALDSCGKVITSYPPKAALRLSVGVEFGDKSMEKDLKLGKSETVISADRKRPFSHIYLYPVILLFFQIHASTPHTRLPYMDVDQVLCIHYTRILP